MALKFVPALLRPLRIAGARSMSQVGDFGSGAGKGGGSGGDIRSAGGSFGKMEAAHEEEYFRKLREQQLKEIKKQIHEEHRFHDDEISRHERTQQMAEIRKHMKEEMKKHIEENIDHLEEQVKANQEAIARHKKRIEQLKKKADSDSD